MEASRVEDVADAVAKSTRRDVRGPWHYATLLVVCPVCEASLGASCVRSKSRARPHFERYALARELAGRPLRSTH